MGCCLFKQHPLTKPDSYDKKDIYIGIPCVNGIE